MIDSAPKLFDLELALERAGGSHQLAEELFGMLIRELPSYRDLLRSALHATDYQSLRSHAHKLKGSATYCGVPALGAAAEGLERQVKNGQVGDVSVLVDRLISEIDRLMRLSEEAPPVFTG